MTHAATLNDLNAMRIALLGILREGCPALGITEILRDLDRIALAIVLQ